MQVAISHYTRNTAPCTGWLTLVKGLVIQSILTDSDGKGQENLWRNVTAIPAGFKFDIHFQVIDKVTN